MSRAGEKSFRRCDVKVIELKEFVFADRDKEKTVLSRDPTTDIRVYAGSGAVLHCPRTDDERVSASSQYTNHPSRLKAVKSLQKIAGELLCRDCRFSSMSPVEVAQERAALARAETERLEAIRLKAQALDELAQVDPAYRSLSPEE